MDVAPLCSRQGYRRSAVAKVRLLRVQWSQQEHHNEGRKQACRKTWAVEENPTRKKSYCGCEMIHCNRSLLVSPCHSPSTRKTYTTTQSARNVATLRHKCEYHILNRPVQSQSVMSSSLSSALFHHHDRDDSLAGDSWSSVSSGKR